MPLLRQVLVEVGLQNQKLFSFIFCRAHRFRHLPVNAVSREITCTDVIAMLWVKFSLSGTQRCTRLQDVAATRTATCVFMWSQVPAHTDSSAHLASFREHSFDNAVLNTFGQTLTFMQKKVWDKSYRVVIHIFVHMQTEVCGVKQKTPWS